MRVWCLGERREVGLVRGAKLRLTLRLIRPPCDSYLNPPSVFCPVNSCRSTHVLKRGKEPRPTDRWPRRLFSHGRGPVAWPHGGCMGRSICRIMRPRYRDLSATVCCGHVDWPRGVFEGPPAIEPQQCRVGCARGIARGSLPRAWLRFSFARG